MRSKSSNVDDYLTEVPEERREALRTLRADCVDLLSGFEELMTYGMPSYWRNGEVEVGFASQKSYISLYVLRTDVHEAHRDQLEGRDVVRSMLTATAQTTGRIC